VRRASVWSVDDIICAGMRGAYGKPYGLAARVTINQVMFSIRTTLKGEEAACEALRKVLPLFGNPLDNSPVSCLCSAQAV